MKNKTRRLWLNIKYKVPVGVSSKAVTQKLIRAIEAGTYHYPKSWKIALGWSNKEEGELRWGEFRTEMRRSRQSSDGFDAAVLSYLESKP